MGIPGFARHLVKDNNTHLWDKNMKFHYLFFDFNPIIYECVRDLELKKSWNFKNMNNQFEKELINLIFEKVKHIVLDVIKPIKLLYIAIDGPSPFAKMKQQRLRRYKSMYTDDLYKKYYPNEFNEDSKWDTRQISPGTIFMYNLNKKLKREINNNAFGNIKVIFNGSDIPGEGEHKFIPYLSKIKVDKNENYCVYSTDADQIIILLPYTTRNIYVLKPISELRTIEHNYDEYYLMDVNYIAKKYEIDGVYNKNFLHDFTFISFLEGNDFVMPIYFLKCRDDYMETVIKYYKNIKKSSQQNLIKDNLSVNYNFVLNLFEKISKMEESEFNKKNNMIQTLITKYNKNPNLVKKCKMDFENMEHTLFYCPSHPLYKEYINDWNKFFTPKFSKKEYYKYFFGKKVNIDSLCYEYARVLIFNLKYYLERKTYWRYQYPYPIAPLPTDFYQYLLNNPKIFDSIKFNEDKPYPPFVQLAYILPLEHQLSLPKVYKDKVFNKKVSKNNLKLEMINGDKLIYSEINLPSISIDKLEKYYNKVKDKFTPLEKNIGKFDSTILVYRSKK